MPKISTVMVAPPSFGCIENGCTVSEYVLNLPFQIMLA